MTISGLAGPSLTEGQSYFLLASTDAYSWDVWNINSQGVNGMFAWNLNGGGWFTGPNVQGAFDILSGVPEPATMMLLGAGLLFVLARERAVR